MAGSILTLFPYVVSPPQLLNGFLALTGRKKQSRSWEESRVQRGTCDFLNGTFIVKCCVVIGWLQEAGSSCLSVVGSDHSQWKVKNLLSVCMHVYVCVCVCVCVCLWEVVVCFEPEITTGFLSVHLNIYDACVYKYIGCVYMWCSSCEGCGSVVFLADYLRSTFKLKHDIFIFYSLKHIVCLMHFYCIAQFTIRRSIYAHSLAGIFSHAALHLMYAYGGGDKTRAMWASWLNCTKTHTHLHTYSVTVIYYLHCLLLLLLTARVTEIVGKPQLCESTEGCDCHCSCWTIVGRGI